MRPGDGSWFRGPGPRIREILNQTGSRRNGAARNPSGSALLQKLVFQALPTADLSAVVSSLHHLIEQLSRIDVTNLEDITRVMAAKSPWTASHSERVTELSLQVGNVLGLSANEIEILRQGGLLHDVGKLCVPPAILNQARKLSGEHYLLLREHPCVGAFILESTAVSKDVVAVVLQHHERFDGTGYPNGLAGEDISVAARVLTVADWFDALISDRPYRPGFDRESTIGLIKQRAGSDFDPKVVKALVGLLANGEGIGKT